MHSAISAFHPLPFCQDPVSQFALRKPPRFGHFIKFCHDTGSLLLIHRNAISRITSSPVQMTTSLTLTRDSIDCIPSNRHTPIIDQHFHSICLTTSQLEYSKNNWICFISCVSCMFPQCAQNILNSLCEPQDSIKIKPHDSLSSRRPQVTGYSFSSSAVQVVRVLLVVLVLALVLAQQLH